MTIHITAQHLDGNSPEGFDNAAFCAALEIEYTQVVRAYVPNSEVAVEIDRQRNTSGASRSAEVYAEDGAALPAGLETEIAEAANRLFEARGDEFYDA